MIEFFFLFLCTSPKEKKKKKGGGACAPCQRKRAKKKKKKNPFSLYYYYDLFKILERHNFNEHPTTCLNLTDDKNVSSSVSVPDPFIFSPSPPFRPLHSFLSPLVLYFPSWGRRSFTSPPPSITHIPPPSLSLRCLLPSFNT